MNDGRGIALVGRPRRRGATPAADIVANGTGPEPLEGWARFVLLARSGARVTSATLEGGNMCDMELFVGLGTDLCRSERRKPTWR
jgi:hypothetical protein